MWDMLKYIWIFEPPNPPPLPPCAHLSRACITLFIEDYQSSIVTLHSYALICQDYILKSIPTTSCGLSINTWPIEIHRSCVHTFSTFQRTQGVAYTAWLGIDAVIDRSWQCVEQQKNHLPLTSAGQREYKITRRSEGKEFIIELRQYLTRTITNQKQMTKFVLLWYDLKRIKL